MRTKLQTLMQAWLFVPALFLYATASAQVGKLEIHQLTGDCYVYTTYKALNGEPFPSNSMYVVTDDGVIMIDTPWDTTQFQPLLDSIAARHHQPVVLCIATHFHDDRTAGLAFLNSKGIATYTSGQTAALCIKEGNPQPRYTFTKDTSFTIGGTTLQTHYAGAGHTADNIVVWLPAQKILFGGCLVKSTENTSMGNIADANLKAWPKTIRNLTKRYPDAKYIIPGHFGWMGETTTAYAETLG